MKLGDFLNNLAKKAGKENDPALVAILSSSDVANREINDEFASHLDTNLMSLEGAKNNPAVLNHFKPIILAGIDDKYTILAEKFGASDEIASEKSTYKKIDIIVSKIDSKLQALEAQKGKGGNAEKEEQLTKQIQSLQGQLSQLTDKSKSDIDGLKLQHANELTDMQVKFALTGKKYANKDIPADVNVLTAKTLLENSLKQAKATLVNENGTLKLKQSDNPALDYMDANNKLISFDDFTNQLLANNKLLEVSVGGNNPPATQPAPQHVGGNGTQNNMSQFNDAINASMGDVK